MGGGATASPSKRDALAAFERGDEDAAERLTAALRDYPNDGALLIAEASARLRSGRAEPFARLEAILNQAPDWIEGHKGLSRLKAEAQDPAPLSSLEGALRKLPRHPGLWMAYLTLLGSAARHSEAAQHAANLRQRIADLPELRLVEARHRGFAGQAAEAQDLLKGLPDSLPELDFERARNALRLGDLARASEALDRTVKRNPNDIGAWALTEICWRANKDPRHEWLCPDANIFVQSDLSLSARELADLAEVLKVMHVTRSAPLGQSVEGGTQTHGNLRLRIEPEIARIFQAIDAALAEYAAGLPPVHPDHPLAPLAGKTPQIMASWSILLSSGGRHVPHLHDGGRVSSAAHIAVPSEMQVDEGALELGCPPEDIALDITPLARFAAIPGHLVLFPSFVYHSTTRFEAGERLTLAFDAV
ncbi:MAG: hypothetical protein HRT64_02995 [Erythrobacter sp.]|nr:hypothetical protein [Erythrobacter sp.]